MSGTPRRDSDRSPRQRGAEVVGVVLAVALVGVPVAWFKFLAPWPFEASPGMRAAFAALGALAIAVCVVSAFLNRFGRRDRSPRDSMPAVPDAATQLAPRWPFPTDGDSSSVDMSP